MKNMKWKVFFSAFLAAAVFFGIFGVSGAEAEVKVTIKNNRSHNMSFAFRWAGFDPYHSKGWWTVKAGETRTITIQTVMQMSSGSFGYYATGGGSTWRGNNDTGREGWIHPKESFEFEFFPDDNPGNPKSGMQKVLFRPFEPKRGAPNPKLGGGDRGSATLTFNPSK